MGTSQNKKLFNDYDGFTGKFIPKKTTDDCYTPPEVYETVLQWVRENFDIEGCQIVRPFYPNGDFENYDYPDNCVVVDNPPFSIFTYILKWYVAHGIKFFLFAPQLTTAGSDADVSYIICNVTVTYENGAKVNTSFATNLTADYRFWCNPQLAEKINQVQQLRYPTKPQPFIKYADCITTSAYLGKIADHGVDFKIKKSDCKRIRKSGGHNIFGSGYILSKKATAEYKLARQKAEDAKNKKIQNLTINIPLTAQEIELQKRLGGE